MKKTKEEIIKINTRLELEIVELEGNDRHLRAEFTKVLNVERGYSPYDTVGDKRLTWEEIFFRIGELNSDANYTILLEQKRLSEEELNRLKEQ